MNIYLIKSTSATGVCVKDMHPQIMFFLSLNAIEFVGTGCTASFHHCIVIVRQYF